MQTENILKIIQTIIPQTVRKKKESLQINTKIILAL